MLSLTKGQEHDVSTRSCDCRKKVQNRFREGEGKKMGPSNQGTVRRGDFFFRRKKGLGGFLFPRRGRKHKEASERGYVTD